MNVNVLPDRNSSNERTENIVQAQQIESNNLNMRLL